MARLVPRALCAALVASVLFLGCSPETPLAPEVQTEPVVAADQTQAAKAVPDEYIVLFDESRTVPPGLAQQLAASHGLQIKHEYQHAIQGFAARIPPQALAGLQNNPHIKSITPNFMYTLTTPVATPIPVSSVGLRVRLIANDLVAGDVASWPNRGSEGDAVQSKSAKRPAYRAPSADFGGNASVGFNEGTDNDELLEISGVSTHASGTLIAVFRAEDNTAPSSALFAPYGARRRRAVMVASRNGLSDPMDYSTTTMGSWLGGTLIPALGQSHVGVWRVNAGVIVDLQLDGTAAGSAAISSGMPDFNRYFIGMAQPSSAERFDGQLAEMLFYDRVLPDCERDDIVAALGAEYDVSVAVTGGGCGPPEPPAAPTDLGTTATGTSAIDLGWTDGSSNETGFSVERSLGQSGTWSEVATTGPDVVTFGDTGLNAETEYCYQVRAFNVDGSSAYTNISCATTDAFVSLPPPVVVPTAGLRVRLVANDVIPGDVASWPNRGSDGDAVQANTAKQPAYHTASADFGGNASVGFNEGADNDELLEISGVTTHTSGTLFAVFQADDNTAPSSAMFAPYGNSSSRTVMVTSRNGLSSPMDYSTTSMGAWLGGTLVPAPGQSHVAVWRVDAAGAKVDLQLDGAPAGSGAVSSGMPGFDRYLVGMAQLSSTERFDGRTAEILFYDRALPDCERDDIVASLGAQYGVSVAVTGGPCDPPADPSGLSATATGFDVIDLAWTDGSSNEDGFRIERRLGEAGSWSQIALTGPNVTSYSDSGLSEQTDYCYRIRAVAAGIDSGNSNMACATTDNQPPPQPPTAPTALGAVAAGSGAIDIGWTDGSSNETGFSVERSLGQSGTWSEVATTGPDVVTFGDTGLNAETEYCYQVRAFNVDGSSAYTNISCATTDAFVSLPPPVVVPTAGLRVRLVANDVIPGDVASWPNRGSDGDAVQANTAKQPAYHTASADFGGNASVGFNEGADNDELLEISGVTTHTSGTLFAVFQADDNTATSSALFAPYGARRRRTVMVTSRNGLSSPMDYSTTSMGAWLGGTLVPAPGQSHVAVWRVDAAGAKVDLQLDGAPAGSGAVSSGMPSFKRYLIGMAQPSSGERFDGRIAELLFYDNALVDCERDNVVATLGAQYGVPVSVSSTVCNAPGDPTGLSATTAGFDAVDLAWTDGSSDEDGFRVERRLGQAGTWSEIAVTGLNSTTFSDSGLGARTEYCYRVRAFNADGESGNSNTACATTDEDPSIPTPVVLPTVGLRVRLIANDLPPGDVSVWPNRGSDGDAVQGNALKRPTYQTPSADFGGSASVGFNEGTDNDELLEIGGVAAHSSGTLLAVFRAEDNSAPSSAMFAPYGASTSRTIMVTSRTGLTLPMDYSETTTGAWLGGSLTPAPGQSHIAVWRVDAGVIADLQLDGAAAGSQPGAPAFPAFDRYLVGMAQPSSTERFDGRVAEILFYDYALADCARDDIVALLGAQYGVSVAVTGGPCNPPADPSGLSATAVTYNGIDLAWTDGSNNEDGFRIERRLGQAGSWLQISTTAPDVQTYESRGLTQQTEYCYRVQAVNTDGGSAYTNISCDTTPAAPPGACVDSGNHDDLSALYGIQAIGAPANDTWASTQLAGCEIKAWYFGLDSGVDSDHPDLNVVEHLNFVSAEPGHNGEDGHGHGTHTAGTAAAIDGNGGVVGVAPGAAIYSFRVCEDGGSCESADMIAAMDEVVARKQANPEQPMVANMSIGGPIDAAMDQALRSSINEGIVYAVSAGNGALGACIFPANASGVSPARVGDDEIDGFGGSAGDNGLLNGVITTTSHNSSFTDVNCNFGSPVSVAAPGLNIKSTWLSGAYNTISGTSMASPHAAGAALLYLQANPTATPAQVEAAIVSLLQPWTTNDLPNASGRLFVDGL